MSILIISPGKKHEPHLAELIAEYEKRLSGAYAVEWRFVSPGTPEQEGAAILKAVGKGDHVVLLDERGKAVSSEGFAAELQKAVGQGAKRIVFIIGGAYGVDEPVRAAARLTLSLSAMVLPHRLVRLMLVEQIYRATDIIRGGKYHHA